QFIISGGTATSPRVIDGKGAKSLGFDVSASYVVISNFDISTQNGFGVYLHNADHILIDGNRIHDLCREAVFMESTVSAITVSNSTIVKAGMAGIEVN